VVREGKVVNGTKELRIKLSPPAKNTLECVQGQICSRVDKKFYVGSGSINLFYTSFVLLTCAHNFVHIEDGLTFKLNFIETSRFDYSKDGSDYFNSSYIKTYTIYPGYFTNSTIYSGFDLAVGFLEGNFDDAPMSLNSSMLSIESAKAKKGDVICIIGYPAEYGGDLYKMEGTIKQILDVGTGRKLILYDDIDTSGGQSGSPIYLKRKNNWYKIGVHIGYDASAKVNVGTAITTTVFKWIEQESKKFLKKSIKG